MQNKLIIGLVGLYSSGKDTVARHLLRKGFKHYSLSDILREEMKRGYVAYRNRDDLIRTANTWRKQYGSGYLAGLALEKAKKYNIDRLIISSIRNLGEVEEFKKAGNFFMIAVKASMKIRFERTRKRGKIDDNVSFSKFRAQELFERKGSKYQQQNDQVMAEANFSVNNNRTIGSLNKKVDVIYQKIMKKIKKLLIRNIIILGPQGSGKGTQAELIAKKFHLRHIETGQMLRKIATRNAPLGKVINRLINQKGKIVPDRLMTGILKTALKNVPNNIGIVFDGYPRTLRQAKILEAVLRSLGRELTHVFYLPISQKTTIKRLSLRRMCKRCGTIFILGKNLKQGIMRCPKCGGEIYQRPDDRPRVIRTRLREYYRRTKPVVGYYKRNRLLIEIDGEPPIPEVYKNILKRIQQ